MWGAQTPCELLKLRVWGIKTGVNFKISCEELKLRVKRYYREIVRGDDCVWGDDCVSTAMILCWTMIVCRPL